MSKIKLKVQQEAISHASKGSMLRPFKALAFLGRKPVTEALQARIAADIYRGFHLNDWDKCIGCSTCHTICDNAAIQMVYIPDLPSDLLAGKKPFRPAIDYGRCCWCGLCVDICPTGSLALSKEYIHTCTEDHIDSYFILPDPKGMHKQPFEKGWEKSDQTDLLLHHRQTMQQLPALERIQNFDEIVQGFTDQAAFEEASRCIQCGFCHDACPAQMHAPEYIRAIWEHNFEQAVTQIYRTNPFPNVCGRVCTHRCESACAMQVRGEAIAIRWLKRYAIDKVPHARVKALVSQSEISKPDNNLSVAIIGAGPAGLTAAFDLVQQGHKVKVFEAADKAGGMMRYGIPEYRLPADKLDEDIAIITSMGVEIVCNTIVGKDVSMEDIVTEYDAVLLATGLQQGRSSRIPGSNHKNVYSAIELLAKIKRQEDFIIPHKAVIIGGGNVAMDIARSLARLQQQYYANINIIVTTLETKDAMLADDSEKREALEEGIVLENSRGPLECMVCDDETLEGLKTVACLTVFDKEGRFHPQYDYTDEVIYSADMVVEAIGQNTVLAFLGDTITEQLEWQQGKIKVDNEGHTALEWLWSVGDMVKGSDVIHAIAKGHQVAKSIDTYLQNIKVFS